MRAADCKIVVVGAGFGGLTFCQRFQHPRATVTVVDRTNHHLFQPLLYQVATAGLSAPDIAQPVRSILSHRPRLIVLMDEVEEIDLAGRRVICRENRLDYDYLVLAMGGLTSYFGHPEWEEFAPGMKTLEDALRIRRNVLLAFERAENRRDPEEQARLTTIVIVGGGPTGVELAGACAELAHRVLKRDFDHVDPGKARIILIEALPRVLTSFPEDLSEKARRSLERLGVQVRTGCPVKAISPGTITLEHGEVIHAENIVWAAGVRAHPLTTRLGVELDRAGRIKVAPDLSLPGHPEVFAVGDLVSLTRENGTPVPGVAPAAIQMAQYVARVIKKELDQGQAQARPAFHYRDKGNLATIGRSAGIAQFGRIKLQGFIAWFAWLVVHLIFLIGFRNKLSVLVSWTYSYFTYRLGARIITGWPEAIPSKKSQP
ncbi:MAG TPA: NAD(P)/FAD-dependent oxidoreductase [Clostridia bacterium]|nr:NAD(P)/FAD-dependent oxidoreductase [Clostridia bacterium]